MLDNLIQIKTFLGKYYTELNYSSIQEKYKDTDLEKFFEQRFYIQNNKMQMVVDPSLSGLIAIVSGNEIYISKGFYDHPNITVTNSLENSFQTGNPGSLYNPEVFSTIAYLACQNHTMFSIVGEVDEPIYVKYKSDYETFYNSIIIFEIADGISVEIVEEIESLCALNSVTNYVLHPGSDVKLSTFYQNHISGISFVFRNIIAQDNSNFTHVLLGKGSSNIIDEIKLYPYKNSSSEFLGVIDSDKRNFHSILYVQPAATNYTVNVDYRDILQGKGNVTFFPAILNEDPTEKSSIVVSNIVLDDLLEENIDTEIKMYTNDIIDRAVLSRTAGVDRFYNNKTKFLKFL